MNQERSSLARRLAYLEKTVESLGQSEELHRLIVRSISDSVFLTDADGRFRFVCPNADVIFGFSEAEVWEMENIDSLLGPGFLAHANPGDGIVRQNLEWTLTARDGRVHHLLVDVRPVSIRGASLLVVCRHVADPPVDLSQGLGARTTGGRKGTPGLKRHIARLTVRQREVLRLIAEGHGTREIARILRISMKTVETHRSQLMKRLDIHDVAGLVRFAIRAGVVSLES